MFPAMSETSFISHNLVLGPTGDVNHRQFLTAVQAGNIELSLQTVDSQVDGGQHAQLRERRKGGDLVVRDIK